MYRMLFELLKEDNTLKEKITDVFIIVWYSLGLIVGLFLITVGLIPLRRLGICIVFFYLFIEFMMYCFNYRRD